MVSINRAIIIGRTGQDPQISYFQNGGKIANFSVATSESWKDKATGEKKERTEWHRVVVTSPTLADFAERYLRKGNQVYVEGKLQTREWTDQNGLKRQTTEINVGQFGGNLLILESKQSTSESSPAQTPDIAPAQQTQGWEPEELDDDIPF